MNIIKNAGVVIAAYFFTISMMLNFGLAISEWNDYEYRFELAGYAPLLIIEDTKNIFIPTDTSGIQHGPLVFVSDYSLHDEDVIVHEKTHVKQFYKVIPHVLSLFSDKYLVIVEAEAYRSESYKYSDIEIAQILKMPEYKINLTREQILSIIN